jgi:hypothetical protein
MSKPIHKVQEGSVKFAIFENDGPKGKFQTAALEFQYKDKTSGEWRESRNFGVKDLENLEKAAREARSRMTKKSAPIDNLDV